MQVHCIGRFRQPVPIVAEFDYFRGREELNSIRRRISERFQQPGRDENWNIVRLTIQHPSYLLNSESSR